MAGIFVVMQLIVFGVKQMDPGFNLMKPADLLLQGNELIPFFGIAGNGETGDRKLKAPLRFGSRDNGIVAEDFFGFVRIGGFAPDANAGGSIVGELGTAKSEGVGRLAYPG